MNTDIVPVPPLHNLFVFRIEHVSNLEYILEHGMHVRDHPMMNPNHLFIGNPKLTATRHEWPVRPSDVSKAVSERYGTLGEYVPFYFGPCSPMLFVIKNGQQGVPQRPQRDIVYIGCRFRTIVESGARYAFTDGHAKMEFTDFYSNPENLNYLSWDVIYSRYWGNTEQDFDRTRRKQAEMLVHSHVPPEWIEAVIVYDDEISTFAQSLIQRLNSRVILRVNPPPRDYIQCGFYYP